MSDVDPNETREERFERLRNLPHPDVIQQALDAGRPAAGASDEPMASAAVAEPVVVYDERQPAKTVALAYPFTLDGNTVASVGLLPPPFADVEAVTAGEKSELEMIADMAGLPLAALKAMRWPDIEAVTKAAQRLAPKMERR